MFDGHILSKRKREKMNKKSSGQKLSTQASKIMRSNNSSQIQKSLAASVLSQRNTGKITAEHGGNFIEFCDAVVVDFKLDKKKSAIMSLLEICL